jgi:hypothetical protein
MKTYDAIALGVPRILLPKPGVDLAKWAVIACDQHTSEPEYWRKVEEFVGDVPSALNLIYPEVYLGEPDADARIRRIREHMARYLEEGVFTESEGFVYVERRTGQGLRRGLMVCLDLECYDYRSGSSSLIRASEGTILERIPPRVKIREGAPLEIPHIMVLIDDPDDMVIGPLAAGKSGLAGLYDFDLMMESGRLTGYGVKNGRLEKGVISALQALADPAAFANKYGLTPGTPVLLYAMGDGNHSLATAKTIWEKTKDQAGGLEKVMNSPLRYALVELVNLHDRALVFEPIHRVLFDIPAGRAVLKEMEVYYRGRIQLTPRPSADEMKTAVDGQQGSPHQIGMISPSGFGVIEVSNPESNLPVGTLQNFLDAFMKRKGAREIDYVHGAEAVIRLGQRDGCAGFYLPAMDKRELFRTVILDGALPRKTFSMGEAWEKRFYLEARQLF